MSRWDTKDDIERKKNGPPCGTCKPDLMDENAVAFFIYGLVSDQVIVAPMGGVIGVMDMAVESNMRIHGVSIKEQPECHLKVKTISRTILAEQAKTRDAEKK